MAVGAAQPTGAEVYQFKKGQEMKAKQYLLQYRRSSFKIERLKSDIQRLADLCAGITPLPPDGDRVQSSHDPDRIGAVIAQKADLEAELMDEILNSIDAINDITETLNMIEDVDYQRILQLRYIEFDQETLRMKTWVEIADELHYTERWIQTLHGRALWEVEKIINGGREI